MAKRQSKKDERKRRLLFLILLFVLTLAIGGTATYAWFTSNRVVSVDPLDVQITTANGLQISADAIDWKAKVTKQELIDVGADGTGTYSGSTNQLPDLFGNVSTDGTNSNGKLKMFYGNVEIDQATGTTYMLTTSAAQTEVKCSGTTDGCATKYYAAFDLFFKVDATTDVVLTTNSSVVNTSGKEDRGIQNTARVAMLKLGYTNDPLASGTIQAANSVSQTIFWEPNCNSHTATGSYAAVHTYGFTAAEAANGTGTCGLAYRGVNSQINSPGVAITATGSDTHFSNISSDKYIKTTVGFSDAQDVFTLSPGITKYRIYWWVEGQDVDTENNATNSYMTLNLEFSIKE